MYFSSSAVVMTLLALPQTQRRITSIIDFGNKALSARNLSESDLRQFHTLAAMLNEADYSRIVADTQTALNEDPNFYGVSPSLAPNIKAGLEKYKAATEPFVAMFSSIPTLTGRTQLANKLSGI